MKIAIEGWNCQPFPAYEDAPEIAEIEKTSEESDRNFWTQVIGGAIIGLAVVGAVAIVGVVAAAIAGVAATTAVIGGACAFGMGALGTVIGAVTDVTTGKPRSLGETVVDSLAWAFSGLAFFTGGISAFVMTTAVNFVRTAASSVIRSCILEDREISALGNFLGIDCSGNASVEFGNVSVETSTFAGYKGETTKEQPWHGDPDSDKGNSFGAQAKVDATGSLVSGELSGTFGYLSGSLEASAVNAQASGEIGATLISDGKFNPAIKLAGSAGANLASGEAKTQFGEENWNVHGEASGSLFSAEAAAAFEVGKISQDTKDEKIEGYGIRAEVGAEAYAAQGEISEGLTIWGVEINVTLEGKAGGAGATIGGAVTSGKAGGKISGGLLLGVGLEVEVDWSNLF